MRSSILTHPDARTLRLAAEAEKRRIAMTVREAGTSVSEIGRALGVHYMTVSTLKLPFALWTRAAVVQWIDQKYGLPLPVRTMGHDLARWGFTAQQPIKRAYRQRPEAIDAPTRITFCTRVCKAAARKVYLILDHRNVHTAATVEAWLAANRLRSRCSPCRRTRRH